MIIKINLKIVIGDATNKKTKTNYYMIGSNRNKPHNIMLIVYITIITITDCGIMMIIQPQTINKPIYYSRIRIHFLIIPPSV